MTFPLWYICQQNGIRNVLILMSEIYSKCRPNKWIAVEMNNELRISLQWHYNVVGLSIQVLRATRSDRVKLPASLRIPHLNSSGGLHDELNGKCYIMGVSFFRIGADNAACDYLPSNLLRLKRSFHISEAHWHFRRQSPVKSLSWKSSGCNLNHTTPSWEGKLRDM